MIGSQTEWPAIRLLDACKDVSTDDLIAQAHGCPIFACDCYLRGAEHGEAIIGGFRIGAIINIDHHAPTERMAQQISSANLALDWVRANGAAPPQADVFITHTDCDSVLSSGIIRGLIEPLDEFGAAALTADHTGEKNDIADVLQALDSARDLGCSLRNLNLLLRGQPLEPLASNALSIRRQKRDRARRLIEGSRFRCDGGLCWGVLEDTIDGEFLPSLLPDASLILSISPSVRPEQWDIKLRLGNAAPAGLNLQTLGVTSFDSAYGGRWNAGSNKRGGGTALFPEQYADGILNLLEKWTAAQS
jgi:hypothetical protein